MTSAPERADGPDPRDFIRSVLAHAPVILFCVDAEGRFTLREGRGLEAFGGAPPLIGQSIFDVYAGHPSIGANIRRALAGESFTADVAAGGTIFEVRYEPLRDPRGVVEGAVGVATDVGARRRAEEEARRNLWFLNAVVENIPDMIFVKDAHELRFVRLNRAGEELLGYAREELLGKNDYDFFPRKEADWFTAKDHAALESHAVLDIPEEAIHTKARGLRFLHTKKISVRDADGRPAFLLGISEDMTDQKLLEAERKTLLEKLQELDRVKARLIANMSHELRTPLTLVLGALERLLEKKAPSDPDRRELESGLRNARVLLGLVGDVLDISKMEAGRVTLHYAEADLARLVRQVTALFEATARDRGVSLEVDAPEELPAEVDPPKIQRIVANLLANALKFTPRGGSVQCRVEASADRARIVVSDTGPGVPDAIRERIFEPFFQGEGDARGGTGLGLAIVRELVALHEATIAVDDAPGGGARFTIDLPATARPGSSVARRTATAGLVAGEPVEAPLEPVVASAVPLAPPGPGDAERALVLVVEDHPELRSFLAESLERDHRVAKAADGREALDKIVALHPDLVLTDLMMPGMSGEELVAAVRARPELAPLPIVVLTAKADDELRVRLLAGGAQDYVMKPVSIAELRARVGNLVAAKRARDLLHRELQDARGSLDDLTRDLVKRSRELATALGVTRTARDAAVEASEAKSRFLDMVSHELRTPLTNIGLQLALLPRELGGTRGAPSGPSPAEKIGSSWRRLVAIVDGLLEQARIQSGRLVVKPEAFDAAALARRVVADLEPQCSSKGLAVEVVAPAGPAFTSDARLIEIVLANLVGNAVKFTDHGRVDVSVVRSAGTLVISVTDTGVGIPVHEQARVFEPFEQLEAPRNKHLPGVGLGLALVKEITEALGGTVELVSRVGVGSRFTVQFPELVPVAS